MEIKSYAKVNIFLQITGKRDSYHLLASRFVKVSSFFDIVGFTKNQTNSFKLIGDFSCDLHKNTMYKAYLELTKRYPTTNEFFREFSIEVQKNISEFAGLGGGSSNAAALLCFVNNYQGLNIAVDELASIGANIGADVPFFVYEYDSANVSGIGEVVSRFDEEVLDIQVITPKIKCDTGAVFKEFRNSFYHEISELEANKLFVQKSIDISKTLTPKDANALLLPAVKLYPQLKEYAQDGWFFSGSGSSFFKIKG